MKRSHLLITTGLLAISLLSGCAQAHGWGRYERADDRGWEQDRWYEQERYGRGYGGQGGYGYERWEQRPHHRHHHPDYDRRPVIVEREIVRERPAPIYRNEPGVTIRLPAPPLPLPPIILPRIYRH